MMVWDSNLFEQNLEELLSKKKDKKRDLNIEIITKHESLKKNMRKDCRNHDDCHNHVKENMLFNHCTKILSLKI